MQRYLMLSRGNFYAENITVTKFCHLPLRGGVIMPHRAVTGVKRQRGCVYDILDSRYLGNEVRLRRLSDASNNTVIIADPLQTALSDGIIDAWQMYSTAVSVYHAVYLQVSVVYGQTPLHGHRLRRTCCTTPQHLDNMSRCWDLANFCPLVVLYSMSVAGVCVVEFGT